MKHLESDLKNNNNPAYSRNTEGKPGYLEVASRKTSGSRGHVTCAKKRVTSPRKKNPKVATKLKQGNH